MANYWLHRLPCIPRSSSLLGKELPQEIGAMQRFDMLSSSVLRIWSLSSLWFSHHLQFFSHAKQLHGNPTHHVLPKGHLISVRFISCAGFCFLPSSLCLYTCPDSRSNFDSWWYVWYWVQNVWVLGAQKLICRAKDQIFPLSARLFLCDWKIVYSRWITDQDNFVSHSH